MAAPSTEQDMRSRIIQAAQDVIIDHGVVGATARKISSHAGISPGTLTYHFQTVDEILEAAFSRLAEQVSVNFRQRLESAANVSEAIEAVLDLICGEIVAAPRNMLLSFELYAYASRNHKIRQICRNWLRRSRDALSLHFDIQIAMTIDALIEGFTAHRHLGEEMLSRDELRSILQKLTSD